MMMNIDREEPQCDLDGALHRIKFCLDHLENQGFTKGVDWSFEVTRRLTMEEVVGALVAAEQELKERKKWDDWEAEHEE